MAQNNFAELHIDKDIVLRDSIKGMKFVLLSVLLSCISLKADQKLSQVFLDAPCRAIDTREATSVLHAVLTAGNYIVPIANAQNNPCGIPPAAKGFIVNLTVIPTTNGDGFLSAYPPSLFSTPTSTINFRDAGRPVANAATVYAPNDPLLDGDVGGIAITINKPLHLIVDVTGYLVAP